MPEITTDDVTKIAKDALYVGVGAGVIAFQKAQVQRVELTKAVTAQVAEARTRIDDLGGTAESLLTEVRARIEALLGSLDADDVVNDAKTRLEVLASTLDGRVKLVEERLDSVEERVEAVLDDLEAKLPEQAREVVKQAREAARDAREQVRAAVGRAA
ncbi:hypothetical protein HC251_16965 [Iamia sp. SCSIO 61187]|uniref:hypothetical protein n=1 Tax=Iamia sp. SCSIO 61187 TaxID=2722752 RepID=UPI001C6265D8|nr:hypothetical protein [Iamia sp. SCSIO 61187]QYG93956.1 hypothetical protein HC251_16965 [Iamia sp. SCSIO 61187]